MIFCIFSFASEEIFADFEIFAKRSSKLAFEGSGRVDGLFVDISSHVKNGDALASLDQTSLEIALKKAKNDLALAKNAKEFAKSTFNKFSQVAEVNGRLNAEYIDTEVNPGRSYEYRILVKTSSGVISKPSQNISATTKELP